jgi:Co/Zn/Cd efflux system component
VFTVFIEDSAALIGLVIAGLGIALGHFFDNPYFDPAASVLIGLLLVGAAFTLARETGALLVGESIGPDATRKVREVFECPSDPAILSVADLQSMQLGPDEVLLTVAVQFGAACASTRSRTRSSAWKSGGGALSRRSSISISSPARCARRWTAWRRRRIDDVHDGFLREPQYG